MPRHDTRARGRVTFCDVLADVGAALRLGSTSRARSCYFLALRRHSRCSVAVLSEARPTAEAISRKLTYGGAGGVESRAFSFCRAARPRPQPTGWQSAVRRC